MQFSRDIVVKLNALVVILWLVFYKFRSVEMIKHNFLFYFLFFMHTITVVVCSLTNWLSFMQHIPNWFSREHFSKCKRKAEIVLWNVKGKAWTMILVFYGSQFVFTGGWAAFAHDNKLQEGDTCIFELVGKTEMRVHILRVVKKVKFVADESV